MGPSASARWGNRLVAWCGLIVGVLVALPPLLRLSQEGWTGPNIFFLAAGTLLACMGISFNFPESGQSSSRTN
jgi:hypothetical protein